VQLISSAIFFPLKHVDMQTRDIIVVGASAGGVPALQALVRNLPPDFQGTVFVVLHIPAYSDSELPAVLNHAGPLPATHPKDGETIEHGKIYVAPPDHHLLVEENRVMVKKGPKENRFRPSIDALFRSAAYVYGPRVIGIVLSGVLNDGTSGLWTIKRHGGIVIIQDPKDAEQPQMPLNVLEYVSVDHVLLSSQIGPLLQQLVKEPAPEKFKFPVEEIKKLKTEVLIATRDNAFEMGIVEMGELTSFTCPECSGALVRLVEEKIIRYRCHTGHAYTASSLLAEVSENVEHMLWKAMRGMEEMVMLMNKISEHFHQLNHPDAATYFKGKADRSAQFARTIHDSIFEMEQYSEDLVLHPPTSKKK
jgi:two-component system, chemotaxis family, protein-glutamate methylesterase/glutaminase